MTYKFLEHTADVKFLAQAPTLEKAFKESALALKQLMAEDVKIKPEKEKTIEIKGKDIENILYNFLEEFIFLLDSEGIILSEIKEINLDEKNLKLSCTFSYDKAQNYKFTSPVKAVTYNEMFVKQDKNNWQIQVVIDI